MKLVSAFTIAAYAAALTSGWRLEIGRDRLTISGEGGRGCSVVDGDSRSARSHRSYNWDGRDEDRERRGERRDETCCVRLHTDTDCRGRGRVQEICDRGSGETQDPFVSFEVDCRRGRTSRPPL